MARIWLVGFGLSVAAGMAACSQSSSDSGVNVQIVAGDDGTVEVIAHREVLFALAGTGLSCPLGSS